MNRLRWNGGRGFYEVFYAKVVQDDASLWVRYTLLAPRTGDAVAETWAIADVNGERHAHKQTHPATALRNGRRPFFVETPTGRLSDNGCRGEVGNLAWNLVWLPGGDQACKSRCKGDQPHAEETEARRPARNPLWELAPPWKPREFRHLPLPAYHLPLPKTKVDTPHPDLRVVGHLQLDGRRIRFQAAPGQQGHVWGRQHAQAWAWSHCNAAPGVAWEALTASVRLPGGRTSPPITTVLIRNGDRALAWRMCLRRPSAFDVDGYRFDARRGPWRIQGNVSVSTGLGCVTYQDPDGTPAYCHNTKRADSHVRLSWRGEPVGEWSDQGNTAYEVGLRHRLPGVPLLL